MPRSLLERRQPDSIREFRGAAIERRIDGNEAAKAGRRTAAIYLRGYSAEMTLKAAYFSVIGFEQTRAITLGDLQAAKDLGRRYSGTWPGNLHNVRAWADLLVEYRSRIPGKSYLDPGFGEEVRLRCRWIEPLWSETLRYRKNVAYTHEVEKVGAAAGWLLEKSPQL